MGEVVKHEDHGFSLETDTGSYDLVGDRLKNHVGKTVEVTGTVVTQADDSSKLTVTSFKEVG